MVWRLVFGGGVVAIAGATFFLILNWPSLRGSTGPAHEISDETMCEVELGPERCPAKPELLAGRPRIFFDRHDKAHLDVERCMLRAQDFAQACRPKGPVSARFYKGRALVRATQFKL